MCIFRSNPEQAFRSLPIRSFSVDNLFITMRILFTQFVLIPSPEIHMIQLVIDLASLTLFQWFTLWPDHFLSPFYLSVTLTRSLALAHSLLPLPLSLSLYSVQHSTTKWFEKPSSFLFYVSECVCVCAYVFSIYVIFSKYFYCANNKMHLLNLTNWFKISLQMVVSKYSIVISAILTFWLSKLSSQ